MIKGRLGDETGVALWCGNQAKLNSLFLKETEEFLNKGISSKL